MQIIEGERCDICGKHGVIIKIEIDHVCRYCLGKVYFNLTKHHVDQIRKRKRDNSNGIKATAPASADGNSTV